MPIDVGDTIPFAADVYDANGALANALTVTLTITLPDGTTVTPTVTNPPSSTGHYGYDYATVQAGPHDSRWLFTFTGGNTAAHTEHYDVRPAATGSLISLADAKEQLKITATTWDERIRGFIASATEVVERHTRCATYRRTEIEDHRLTCPSASLILKKSPAISVTSVASVDGSITWDASDLYLSKTSGIVASKSGGWFSGHLEVTYVAGSLIIPMNYADAAMMIVEHLWQTRRGSKGGPRVGGMDDTVMVPGMGFAVPRAALELLGPISTMAH